MTTRRIALSLLMIAAPMAANATFISDIQQINTTLSAATPTYSSSAAGTSFDLTDNGVPGSATVLSAVVSFTLLDFDGNQEIVQAVLGGSSLYGVSSPLMFSAFGGAVSGSLVSVLNVTGVLDYTLNYLVGSSSVFVSQGALMADVVAVPEPGTLSLLGASLVVLGALKGRRRKVRPATT